MEQPMVESLILILISGVNKTSWSSSSVLPGYEVLQLEQAGPALPTGTLL